MMNKLIAGLALCVASLVASAAPFVGGNASAVAAEQAAQAGAANLRKPTSACYWQVPGSQQWVNTNALMVTVTKSGKLNLYYGYRTELEYDFQTLAGAQAAAESFFKRIEECNK